jgi:hypothetical protein
MNSYGWGFGRCPEMCDGARLAMGWILGVTVTKYVHCPIRLWIGAAHPGKSLSFGKWLSCGKYRVWELGKDGRQAEFG